MNIKLITETDEMDGEEVIALTINKNFQASWSSSKFTDLRELIVYSDDADLLEQAFVIVFESGKKAGKKEVREALGL